MPRTLRQRLWIDKIYDLLGDGPVAYIHALEEGMRYVPPGPAWRVGAHLKQRQARYRNFGADVDVDLSDTSSLVRNGAREIVIQDLRPELRSGRLRKYDDSEGRKWIELNDK